MAAALLATLAATAGELVSVQQRRDRERELLSIGRQFRAAIRAYRDLPVNGVAGQYPSSLDELIEDRRIPGQPRHHLRKLFFDPMTSRQDWGTVLVAGRIVGVYSKSSDRPLRQSGFDEGEELRFNAATSYKDWLFSPA